MACMIIIACSWENDDKQQNQHHLNPPTSPLVPTDPTDNNADTIVPVEPDIATRVQNPPLLSKSSNGHLELVIAYKNNKIFNPNTDQWDNVLLRGYLTNPKQTTLESVEKSAQDVLVGPQIRVKQGQTIHLNLHNQLPKESEDTCPTHVENMNVAHCFNTTNLHTHGLWISPQGKSDNVFVRVNPSETFHHEFKIEPNHPAGTFWYHSHVHGSTALQVSSGMAGPLIVEGSRIPVMQQGVLKTTGDIDILWKDIEKPMYPNEKIIVFQQIQYTCENPDKNTIVSSATDCNGKIEDYTKIGVPASWGQDKHFTSINGKVLGEINVTQNDFFRWRMIHAGIRDTIGVVIKELPNSQNYSAEQTLKACMSYQDNSQIEKFQKLKTLPVYTFAQDGLTMHALQRRGLSVFQPGYRQDAMLAFPTTNKYCVYDTKLNLDDQINTPTGLQLPSNNSVNAQLLAWVNVEQSTTAPQTPTDFLSQKAQQLQLSSEIVAQLKSAKLDAFVSHSSLMTPDADRLITSSTKQYAAFGVGSGKFGIKHDPQGELISFGDTYTGKHAINGQYVRQLKIGETEEWELTSISGGHPFHIHVNPFQIIKVLDTKGNDVSDFEGGAIDYNVDGSVDVQYRGLKGTWKDTIFVKNGYRVIVRSRYEKFEGDFVLHCHILDHEDKGMMEIVRICGDKFPCDADLPSHDHVH